MYKMESNTLASNQGRGREIAGLICAAYAKNKFKINTQENVHKLFVTAKS